MEPHATQDDPVHPASEDRSPRFAPALLWIGAGACVAAVAQLVLDVHPEIGVLAVNLGLVAGAYGLLLTMQPRLREAGPAGILQFVGFVAMALLGRVWLGQTAQGLAILFEYSFSLGALAIAAAALAFRLACTRLAPARAATVIGLLGAGAFLAMAISLLATSPTRRSENMLPLALACIIVAILLAVQWAIARRSKWKPANVLATPLALAVAGSQLFDGVLTYLVVGDPLGIAPDGYEEQIPVSRFLLEHAGIGFPVVKWAIGVLVASGLGRAEIRWTANRVAIYLGFIAAGLGPGLYSASQLF